MKSRILQAVACLILGILVGWWWFHPSLAPIEGEALQRELPKSGATVLARGPSAPVAKPIAAAIKESGGKPERVVHLEVTPVPIPAPVQTAPHSVESSDDAQPAAPESECSCAPVQIDLALVRMPDETHRVLALGANGEEIAGIDVPFRVPAQRAEPRWSALVMYGPDGYGAGGTRRVGPVELGAAAIKLRGEMAYFAVAQSHFR